MNYPNGPYGQGFPGQPGQPQQPGYQQQPPYPQQPGYPPPGHPQEGFPQQGFGQQGFPGYPPSGGYPPQPYLMPTGEPSGGTAITAAVLAALGGVAGLVGGVLGAIGLAVGSTEADLSGGVYALLIVGILFNFVFGLMIATGAVMLFQRKMLGRWLVVSACALAILSSLLSLGAAAAMSTSHVGLGGGFFTFLGLIFPIATLVLALLPSTTAWLDARPDAAVPQHYPPYPGY
ncbi:hypothetical protein [[Mycobacterium] fortunisiensis]|uniref:hypothetical protein n=1 Tax=[Mycobacterium] fortunisiensis TaxID=2600579 RepID=UPI001C27F745|nr:hypothetical protein [[Mycobacterium] fortunisiensis]